MKALYPLRLLLRRSLVCAAVAASTGFAQSSSQLKGPAPAGMMVQPCPPTIELPPQARDLLIELFISPRKLTPADIQRLTMNPQFKEFEAANRARGRGDWAARCRFHEANTVALGARPSPRIVFMGDSITENWGTADPDFFENGILDRGISGQTSEQMLVRFRADVVALHPKAVHIMAGTNDIAGNTGPTSPENFKNNIMSMAEIARANHIRVILSSIPPTASFNWLPQLDPRPWIKELNGWLRAYASESGFKYVDYYPLLVGSSGEFRADLSNDGVHPNSSGYRLMRALVEKDVVSSDR